MQRLGLASLLGPSCHQPGRVLAMIASRIVAPHTKLATTRWWHTTTLAQDFGVADTDEDDLHAAMDWCVFRQSMTDVFGIVTGGFGNVTTHFGDVTDGPSLIS